ncbi:FecR domain-containing protein [Sulfidibacter corallicola]|uniref:FecR domain-containing protein n=1 Tax=Sulfidibacter corallicola TaxID=2818388 RepID=A0A8A4TMT3_SULCO|nr:FecR domain-containing protein [Sulfidibacter corallicola]QTD47905.1 FecR domain-containing protein [Sulfidibacter corallicola]
MSNNQVPQDILFHRYMTGQADEEELRRLQTWREADDANEAMFREFAAFWQRLDVMRPEISFDPRAGWCELAARLQLGSEEIEGWAAYLRETADAEDRRRIDAWRNADPLNDRAFREFEEVWRQTESEVGVPTFDVEAGWQRLSARLDGEDEASAPKPSPVAVPQPGADRRVDRLGDSGVLVPFASRRRPWARYLGVAAVLVMALGLWLLRTTVPPETAMETVTTADQERRQVSLPDGSTVWLNAGTTLSWPKGLEGDVRRLALTGQAYFEVRHDRRQFLVDTGHARVTVLGTRFDVWARNDKTRVIVRDGSVALANPQSGDRVVLSKGQTSTIVGFGQPSPIRETDAEAALGWLQGRLVFQRQPLSDVIADLELAFGIEVELEDPSLGDRTVTASFDKADVTEILNEICLTLGLTVTFDNGVYILSETKRP